LKKLNNPIIIVIEQMFIQKWYTSA
jgi:hypothetical protein